MARSKKKKRGSAACDCGSGAKYGACCRAFHEGQLPEHPEQLMRARFCAFARGDGDFLYESLAAAHPLKQRPCDEVVAELSRAKQTLRYRDVSIVEARGTEVLFVAHVFERGRDRSFAELSQFVHEDGRWRYLEGLLAPGAHPAFGAASIEEFLAAFLPPDDPRP